MDFDEEEPTQMELNPNPALHTAQCALFSNARAFIFFKCVATSLMRGAFSGHSGRSNGPFAKFRCAH